MKKSGDNSRLRSKEGTRFMLRMKWRWDEQYPKKNRVSKQTLKDNGARFKTELEKNDESEKSIIEVEEDTTLSNTHKWTTEMKVNLLKIEEWERHRGRGFTKRTKEGWMIYRKI